MLKMSEYEIREKKWNKLLKWHWLFNWLPFVDFALVAGSMAMGEETENSDFDIILGCEKKRIFTARICTIALFSLVRKRRKSTDGKETSKDKFCFSHFVTPDSYTLRPPYNAYWQKLYQSLVPIYGKEEKVKKFFAANAWAQDVLRSDVPSIAASQSPAEGGEDIRPPQCDNRWLPKKPNVFRWTWEMFFKTPFGNLVENILKKYQLNRISKKKPVGKNPRVYADDTELELHPDTTRIEKYIQEIRE
ncbi:MAG: hypothetical protein Q8P01_01605 [bacterium]|nr:hypothetical protein [bacterium]